MHVGSGFLSLRHSFVYVRLRKTVCENFLSQTCQDFCHHLSLYFVIYCLTVSNKHSSLIHPTSGTLVSTMFIPCLQTSILVAFLCRQSASAHSHQRRGNPERAANASEHVGHLNIQALAKVAPSIPLVSVNNDELSLKTNTSIVLLVDATLDAVKGETIDNTALIIARDTDTAYSAYSGLNVSFYFSSICRISFRREGHERVLGTYESAREICTHVYHLSFNSIAACSSRCPDQITMVLIQSRTEAYLTLFWWSHPLAEHCQDSTAQSHTATSD